LLCLWSVPSTRDRVAQADQARAYFPLVQSQPSATGAGDQALDLLTRFEDLALGGCGLGVRDTRQPAMEVVAGRAYLILCDEAGDQLAAAEPGTALGVLRRPLGYLGRSLHLVGDTLVVLGSDQPNAYRGHMMVREYDVSSANPPQLLGDLALEVWPSNAVAADVRLYIADDAKLQAVQVSDPAAMHVEFTVDTGYRPNDIAPSDDGLVYLARDESIDLIDGRLGPPALHRDVRSGFDGLRAVRVTADGRHLLAFDEAWVRSGLTDGRLTVYDIGTPEQPAPVGSVTVPAVFDWDKGLIRDFGPILFALDGDLLLVAAHQLVAVDVSAPERPAVVARTALPHRALGLASRNQLVFVAEEGGTLAVFRLRLAGSAAD
jgi:hypothetical protein